LRFGCTGCAIGRSGIAWAAPFLKSHPMKYRGVPYKIDQAIDVHTCWRWSFVMNDRRQSGQTKIGHRAAEIQARSAIDKEREANRGAQRSEI
jgi:hypothetical protein